MRDINQRNLVYELLKKIPKGRVVTYGDIAKVLGIKSARVIGYYMKTNPTPVIVPCHRVVMGDGSIGGFSLGIEKKIKLLNEEGISVVNNKIVNFENIKMTIDELKEILREIKRYRK